MIASQSQIDYIRALQVKLGNDAYYDGLIELSTSEASEVIQDLEYKLNMRGWSNHELKSKCIQYYQQTQRK